jgi:hypothetical protein
MYLVEKELENRIKIIKDFIQFHIPNGVGPNSLSPKMAALFQLQLCLDYCKKAIEQDKINNDR